MRGWRRSALRIPGGSGEVSAYLARPRGADRLPAIIVIHENRGLNAHIEDVARRAALGGYVAIAPDGLSCVGGAPVDQEQARDLFAKTDPVRIAADIVAAVPFVESHATSNGRLGAVGFCYGGGMALRCAVEAQGVDAAVCFYGRALPAEDAARLAVPVMLHYAGSDERINAGIPDFRRALDAEGVPYSLNMYPGTEHGFHNDTSAARYDANAARLAWTRTLGVLRRVPEALNQGATVGAGTSSPRPVSCQRMSDTGIRPVAFTSSNQRRSVKASPSWVGAIGHQPLEQVLAGHVARAVARLPQIELLLEAEQVEVRAHPAARRPLRPGSPSPA